MRLKNKVALLTGAAAAIKGELMGFGGATAHLFVREGDFVQYGERLYEIASLNEPKELFGQITHRIEISAKCIRAREGRFDAT